MKPLGKIIFSLLLYLVLTLHINCNKDTSPHTTVNGTVLEFGTNKPIAGATVFLERAAKDAFLSQAYSTYQTFTSDANGKYTFTFDYEEAYKYQVTSTNASYYPSEHYTVHLGENSINIIQYPPGYLKLHIKNLSGSEQIGINAHWYGGPQQFYGMNVDTILIGSVNGNTSVSIYWNSIKNGITSDSSAILYCPGFDTVTYNINY